MTFQKRAIFGGKTNSIIAIFTTSTPEFNSTKVGKQTQNANMNIPRQDSNVEKLETPNNSDKHKCEKQKTPKCAKLFEMPSWQKEIADQITPKLWECIKTSSDPNREELCH